MDCAKATTMEVNSNSAYCSDISPTVQEFFLLCSAPVTRANGRSGCCGAGLPSRSTQALLGILQQFTFEWDERYAV